MTHDLGRYPTYKDSGLAWLGKIPEHWEVRRGKTLFRCIDIRSKTGEEELLTVSSDRGVVPRSSANVTMFKAESYVGYKLCWPDDLVINSLWAWGRGLGVSRHHGIVSSAYGVYRLRSAYKEYATYIHELVRSKPFNWELRVRSKGIWISRLQLTDESFLGAPFPVPPPDEQAAVVRFLDYADRKIRRYIRAKQQLVKLLEEQTQVIIQRAVTRGLNPDVRLKTPKVAWLGEVPAHWNVLPLKRCVKPGSSISYGIVQPGEHQPEGVPFLQTSNITKPELQTSDLQRTSAEIAASFPRSRIEAGDVILGIRASIGAAHVVPPILTGVNLSRGIARIVPGPLLSADYLVMFLRSRVSSTFWDIERQGTTFHEVSIDTVKKLPLTIPPIAEQAQIVGAVRRQLAPLNQALSRAREEITLLREYGTRLIADVVTGKLDVRAAAAGLPDNKPASFNAMELHEPLDAEEPDDEVRLELEEVGG